MHSWKCNLGNQFLMFYCGAVLSVVGVWLQFGEPWKVPCLTSVLNLAASFLIGYVALSSPTSNLSLIISSRNSPYAQFSAKQGIL